MYLKLATLIYLFGLINCSSIHQAHKQLSQPFKEPINSQQQQNQRCDDARFKCAFRLDCGQALTSYMIHCADLISGQVPLDRCPTQCSRALIALASTELGAKLVDCDCGDSQFCKLSKERIDVCRERVEHEIAENTIVSCSTAKFICSSNTQCLTALTYYNKFCKSMFAGKHCTKRCLNSLTILQRQRNAYKLRTCVCDGTEDFPCEAIKQNTELLCFKNTNYTLNPSIELLSVKSSDQRPLYPKHHHRNHLHFKNHHHNLNSNQHKYDFERRSFRNNLNRQFSGLEFDSASSLDTAPIDLDQIKKSVYFDIMMSEALSSNSTSKIYSFNFIFILISGLSALFRWSSPKF